MTEPKRPGVRAEVPRVTPRTAAPRRGARSAARVRTRGGRTSRGPSDRAAARRRRHQSRQGVVATRESGRARERRAGEDVPESRGRRRRQR